MSQSLPFRSRSKTSSAAQVAGIKTAVEVLSAARLSSSQDATKDRSSLLQYGFSSPAPPKEKDRRTLRASSTEKSNDNLGLSKQKKD